MPKQKIDSDEMTTAQLRAHILDTCDVFKVIDELECPPWVIAECQAMQGEGLLVKCADGWRLPGEGEDTL